ncbi:MAG TPA: asparagine synthase (glutamine-hydrolyzing) [Gemmatimonadales bacterium]|nr:asparagine synthase (glutamine-hydrolyzing) [Gemmatimonadales bacterium]
MCGLAGRFHPVALRASPGWAARASALIAHRGPDGEGQYHDGQCELVHRRLALIDLSPTGHQPMANEDGTIYVVYNGEIYNHRELRTDVERRGHRFRGTSDTEVLVHLYEEYGARMVERLRGIFAFAIYDVRRRTLCLVRDRFGVKPLFYARRGDEWVFASEIKAILALPGFRPAIDRQACYDFLGLGYVPEPATGFANVHALPKATVLTIDVAGSRSVCFHEIAARPDGGHDLDAAVTQVEDALLRAVRGQAVADVPVAALLSGGIDSSLVVAAHRRATGGATATFNVRFPAKSHDETAVAVAVAEHCRTAHRTIDLGDWVTSSEGILDLLRHFDQPFADMSLLPMYWISRAIRDQGIICALSGDGGDEAFGGYPRFWRANRLVQLMRLPTWLGQAVRLGGGALAGWTRDWGRQVAKAVQLAQAGAHDAAFLIAGLSNYLSEDDKRELLRPTACGGFLPAWRHFDGYEPPAVTDLEELSLRLTETLFEVSLPSDMLRKVDMMSMRASIEVRVPLLDENVVALGLTLPHRLKTDGATGKRVLRALAGRWLPAQVAAHPKHGFGVPLDVMVPQDFYEVLEALLLAPDSRTGGFLAPELVRHWLHAFRRAKEGHYLGTISRGGLYQRVFIVLALELWMREHALSW